MAIFDKIFTFCATFSKNSKHITINKDNCVMAGTKLWSRSTHLALISFTWHLWLASRLTLLSTACFLPPLFSQPTMLHLPLDPSKVLIPSVWYTSLSSSWFVSILHNSREWLITSAFLQLICHARDVFFHQNYPELALDLNHSSWGIESWWVAWPIHMTSYQGKNPWCTVSVPPHFFSCPPIEMLSPSIYADHIDSSIVFTTEPWSHWQKNVIVYAHFSYCKFSIKKNFWAIILYL